MAASRAKPRSSTRRSGRDAAGRGLRKLAAFLPQALKPGRPFPCGVPFLMPGSGVVNVPAAPGRPNAADAVLAQTRALNDSMAAALRLCRTNPRCPNVLLLAVPVIRFFLRVRKGRRQVVCSLIAVWMCVPPGVPPYYPD